MSPGAILAAGLVVLAACSAPPDPPAPVVAGQGSVVQEHGDEPSGGADTHRQAAPSASEPASPKAAPKLTAASLLAHVASLPPFRVPGSEAHLATHDVLREALAQHGMTARELPFTWSGLPDATLLNFEVTLGEVSDDGPILILGAHYDSVRNSPGADDNGSGVAVLLALAPRFAARTPPCELRLVLFDAEEQGLVGSRAYVQQLPADERERIVGVVNLESVGYADRRPRSQVMPDVTKSLMDVGDRGDFVLVLGNQASAELAQTVDAALSAVAGDSWRIATYDKLAGQGWVIPDSRRSDHASFWDADVPAVMVTDTAPFRNPHYHRRSDEVGTLDGDFLLTVARGVERALLVLTAQAADD